MPDICVVHLVRRKNGIEPFRSFLESYLDNPAGIDHELLILYKGFSRKADIDPYEELLRDVAHSSLSIADIGLDLRSYFIAAEKCSSKYCCFLNSFSIILDKDWLLKLYQHINQPGVGLVGATGSWGSICHTRITRRREFILRHILRYLLKRLKRILFAGYFLKFPNQHIRTNGFLIDRNIMLKIRRGILLTKMQAYILESGKNSITKQIESMGFRPVVVDRNGKGYEKHEWDISDTFWRRTQENLLISDNQTRKYDMESLSWRDRWGSFAWGSNVENSLDQ